jgi:P-type Cu+ transporter
MTKLDVIEVPVKGMDCAGCAQTVQKAIAQVPGVQSVDVLLSSEKARIRLDPNQANMSAIQRAVAEAGYSVPQPTTAPAPEAANTSFTQAVLGFFGIVFGAVLLIALVGEGLGVFEALTERIPAPLGYALVLIAGYPTFRGVIRAALKRQIISHTLMTVGVIAALVIGEWVTAAIVVFFMRVGDYAERFTTERSRQALKNLTALAPQTARIDHNGQEIEVPIAQVQVGDVVIIRPGEKIPVDGQVISGNATVNQAAITGEAMPVEVGVTSQVFAATIAQLGSIRVRTTHVGADTTFGRIIRLVEEAEAHRADVQRIADKFSAYFLPVVATIATITFLISRNPLSTAAVLVVACSCSFALATPIAMLASIGAAAKFGLLIKGGKYIEILSKADMVLIDKTGTLTLGRPQITDVIALNGVPQPQLLSLTASAERYSEHPLAQAVREAAAREQLPVSEPEQFTALPGIGIKARVNGQNVTIGNRRIGASPAALEAAAALEAQGKTTIFVAHNDEVVGVLGAADTVRPEMPQAITALRSLGLQEIHILTGDNERVAAAVAKQLGVSYQANLLPEDKIAIVKQFQAQGRTVVMVGDGVNDAPALAQADIGIAMGAAGTDVALEAAHIALMHEDWLLVPEAVRIARRTMRVVKTNIAFTILYNLVGLTLAAFGILPPILAAAAQSLPDLGILANSSRLLRYRRMNEPRPPFNLRRWAPALILAAIILGVVMVVGYLSINSSPTVDPALKRLVEAVTGLVVAGAFIGGVLLVAFNQIAAAEEKYGDNIPVDSCCGSDNCACSDEPKAKAPSQTISLDNIEIR